MRTLQTSPIDVPHPVVAIPTAPVLTRRRQKAMLVRDNHQIEKLAHAVIGEGTLWMRTPNYRLGGLTPKQAIARGRKSDVQAIIDSVRYGLFS